jgi:hypothetical protein
MPAKRSIETTANSANGTPTATNELGDTVEYGEGREKQEARARRAKFTYTGRIVTFTVPKTATYRILAFGAQGGAGRCFAGPLTCPNFGAGGRGAEVGGDFSLNAGEILQIAVGGEGGAGSVGGGGGGSFVVGPGNVPLVIAGGGGGGVRELRAAWLSGA